MLSYTQSNSPFNSFISIPVKGSKALFLSQSDLNLEQALNQEELTYNLKYNNYNNSNYINYILKSNQSMESQQNQASGSLLFGERYSPFYMKTDISNLDIPERIIELIYGQEKNLNKFTNSFILDFIKWLKKEKLNNLMEVENFDSSLEKLITLYLVKFYDIPYIAYYFKESIFKIGLTLENFYNILTIYLKEYIRIYDFKNYLLQLHKSVSPHILGAEEQVDEFKTEFIENQNDYQKLIFTEGYYSLIREKIKNEQMFNCNSTSNSSLNDELSPLQLQSQCIDLPQKECNALEFAINQLNMPDFIKEFYLPLDQVIANLKKINSLDPSELNEEAIDKLELFKPPVPDLEPMAYTQDQILKRNLEVNNSSFLYYAAKYIGMELTSHPYFNYIMFPKFFDHCSISTSPTNLGMSKVKIDSNEYCFKWVKDLLIKDILNDSEENGKECEYFLEMEAASDKKLIEINYDFQLNENGDDYYDIVTRLCSAINGKFRDKKNNERKTIDQMSKEEQYEMIRDISIKELFNFLLKEKYKKIVKKMLRDHCEKILIKKCEMKLKKLLSFNIYKNSSPDVRKEKILSFYFDHMSDTVYFIAIDQYGEVIQTGDYKAMSFKWILYKGKNITNNQKNVQYSEMELFKKILSHSKKSVIVITANDLKAKEIKSQILIYDSNNPERKIFYIDTDITSAYKTGLDEKESSINFNLKNNPSYNSFSTEEIKKFSICISQARFAQNPLFEICHLWNMFINYKLNLHPLVRNIKNIPYLKDCMENIICQKISQSEIDFNNVVYRAHYKRVLMFIAGMGPKRFDLLASKCDELKKVNKLINSRSDFSQLFMPSKRLNSNSNNILNKDIYNINNGKSLEKVFKNMNGFITFPISSSNDVSANTLDITKIPFECYQLAETIISTIFKINRSSNFNQDGEIKKILFSLLIEKKIDLPNSDMDMIMNLITNKLKQIKNKVFDYDFENENMVSFIFDIFNHPENPLHLDIANDNDSITDLFDSPKDLFMKMINNVDLRLGLVKKIKIRTIDDNLKCLKCPLLMTDLIATLPYDQTPCNNTISDIKRSFIETNEYQCKIINFTIDDKLDYKLTVSVLPETMNDNKLIHEKNPDSKFSLRHSDKEKYELEVVKPIYIKKLKYKKFNNDKNKNDTDEDSYLKRTFFNVDYSDCINLLRKQNEFSFLFRPCFKGENYITLSYKYNDISFGHLYLEEKEGAYIIDGQTYESLQTLANVFYQRVVDFIKRAKQHYRFLLDVDDNKQLENRLLLQHDDKKRKIDYNFIILRNFPHYICIGYVKRKQFFDEYIKIGMKGYEFHEHYFGDMNDLIRYFESSFGSEDFRNLSEKQVFPYELIDDLNYDRQICEFEGSNPNIVTYEEDYNINTSNSYLNKKRGRNDQENAWGSEDNYQSGQVNNDWGSSNNSGANNNDQANQGWGTSNNFNSNEPQVNNDWGSGNDMIDTTNDNKGNWGGENSNNNQWGENQGGNTEQVNSWGGNNESSNNNFSNEQGGSGNSNWGSSNNWNSNSGDNFNKSDFHGGFNRNDRRGGDRGRGDRGRGGRGRGDRGRGGRGGRGGRRDFNDNRNNFGGRNENSNFNSWNSNDNNQNDGWASSNNNEENQNSNSNQGWGSNTFGNEDKNQNEGWGTTNNQAQNDTWGNPSENKNENPESNVAKEAQNENNNGSWGTNTNEVQADTWGNVNEDQNKNTSWGASDNNNANEDQNKNTSWGASDKNNANEDQNKNSSWGASDNNNANEDQNKNSSWGVSDNKESSTNNWGASNDQNNNAENTNNNWSSANNETSKENNFSSWGNTDSNNWNSGGDSNDTGNRNNSWQQRGGDRGERGGFRGRGDRGRGGRGRDRGGRGGRGRGDRGGRRFDRGGRFDKNEGGNNWNSNNDEGNNNWSNNWSSGNDNANSNVNANEGWGSSTNEKNDKAEESGWGVQNNETKNEGWGVQNDETKNDGWGVQNNETKNESNNANSSWGAAADNNEGWGTLANENKESKKEENAGSGGASWGVEPNEKKEDVKDQNQNSGSNGWGSSNNEGNQWGSPVNNEANENKDTNANAGESGWGSSNNDWGSPSNNENKEDNQNNTDTNAWGGSSWGGNNESSNFDSNNRGRNNDFGGKKRDNNCFNCGKPGHRSSECPEPKKPREGGGRKPMTCFNCGKEGHRSSECPEPKKPREGGGRKPMTCFNCGKEGHRSSECPEPKKPREGGGRKPMTCFNCGKEGHRSSECPEPKKPRDGNRFGGKRNFNSNNNEQGSDNNWGSSTNSWGNNDGGNAWGTDNNNKGESNQVDSWGANKTEDKIDSWNSNNQNANNNESNPWGTSNKNESNAWGTSNANENNNNAESNAWGSSNTNENNNTESNAWGSSNNNEVNNAESNAWGTTNNNEVNNNESNAWGTKNNNEVNNNDSNAWGTFNDKKSNYSNSNKGDGFKNKNWKDNNNDFGNRNKGNFNRPERQRNNDFNRNRENKNKFQDDKFGWKTEMNLNEKEEGECVDLNMNQAREKEGQNQENNQWGSENKDDVEMKDMSSNNWGNADSTNTWGN